MKNQLGLLLVLSAVAIQTLGCSSGQRLETITLTPSAETFLAPDPSANVQLRAVGTYVHPPASKDITSQVTWTSNTPQVAIVSDTGLLSPAGNACGGAIVSASLLTDKPENNTVIGTMTVTVDDKSNPICPQP